MGAERVMRHQLLRDLACQLRLQAALGVDCRQLLGLEFRILGQFAALALHLGGFGIGLRADRDIFARRHRHRTRHQPCGACDQNLLPVGRGGGHAHDQAGGGENAIIGPQHRGPQPGDARRQVPLGLHQRRLSKTIMAWPRLMKWSQSRMPISSITAREAALLSRATPMMRASPARWPNSSAAFAASRA